MASRRRIAIVVFLAIFVVLADKYVCYGATFDEKTVSSFIKTSVECHSNPALAVGVIKDGKVLFSSGFGVRDIATKDGVSTDTLFGIASISKSFTATLLVKLLYEKTNLTVNSKVQELLGDKFQMPDEFRTNHTTFADLLSHKTAVPPNNRIRYDNNLTRETLLERLPMLPSPQQFRVDYMYSNLMYGLNTRLSEVIGGDLWENLMSEHIFKPLGMSRSTFATVLDFEKENNLAKGYMEVDGPKDYEQVTPAMSRQWAQLAGSGAVMSTSDDMLKWLQFHLSGGKDENGKQVMSEEAFNELHKPRFAITALPGKVLDMPIFPFSSMDATYAFGLRNGEYRGYRKISHSGSTSGYRSLMTMLPTEKIGVITLFTGRDDHYLHRVPLHLYLLDTALGFEPWLNESTICSFPEPWKKRPANVPRYRPAFNSSLPLRLDHSRYEGVYNNEAYGNMDIRYNDSLHSLIMTYGWATWQLFLWPDSDDTEDSRERFYAKGIVPVIPFDVKPIYFVTSLENDDVIVGVNASAFEYRVPPVFCKPDHLKTCRESIFNAQTYNAGTCQKRGCDVKTTGNHGYRFQPITIMYIVIVCMSLVLFTPQTK